jgi:hypothetical protein
MTHDVNQCDDNKKKICGIDEAVVSTPRRLYITVNHREKPFQFHISPWHWHWHLSFFNGRDCDLTLTLQRRAPLDATLSPLRLKAHSNNHNLSAHRTSRRFRAP